ncbi:unnamed protein product [Orchesella dallaii]|uniref:Neurexin-4 n=1 Tax=Orchesella dallaii TaxID=48710 RepID=A0ABP1R7L6_9HEXA
MNELFGTRRRWISACSIVIVIWIFMGDSAHGRPSYCLKPAASGNCTDNLLKYFYLPAENTCKIFLWGGCTLNKNVFDDFKACMSACARRNATENGDDESLENDDDDDYEEETQGSLLPSSEAHEEGEGVPPPPPNPHLTLGVDGNATTFTLSSPSSFIQIGPEELTRYQIRNRRSISLEFKTRLPHALLAYHGITNRPQDINRYELYVMLDQGQVKIKHIFGDYSTTLMVGKGLNRDRWHKVQVTIDPGERKIIAAVDEDQTAQVLDGLREHYLYGVDNVELESIIFIGGLTSTVGLDISYLAKTFVGCVRNVRLETSPLKTTPLGGISPLVANQFKDVGEKCLSKCWEPTMKCSRDSKCINYYDHVECDCFTARFKGEKCKEPNIPQLTLFGYSYLTFTVFEWMDRVHSDDNRISMEFKTQLDDSVLFYASGEIPKHNHVAVSIINGSVYVDIDFGNDDPISRHLKGRVTDSRMHILTIIHQGKNVTIQLDNKIEQHVLTGPNFHLHINPDVYIGGGGPTLKNRKLTGLMSSNNFVGCLQEVYFNTKAILYELQQNNLQARHHGLTPPAFGQCLDQKTIPITIPFAKSGFRIPNPNADELSLRFAFKSDELYGTLAYSEIQTLKGQGFWELKYGVDSLIFEVQPDKTLADISAPKNLTIKFQKGKGQWHSVDLSYKSNGEVKLTTGPNTKTSVFLDLFQLSGFITLGTSSFKPHSGFKGCLRRIEIGGKLIDSRQIVGSDDQIGDIALDNCQFINPCHRPDVCEHGGICKVENDTVTCECGAIGYEGKRCHFAKYKRTCEELALLGYTNSGVHKIDIDGNGPYPPSHVKCKFENDVTGETKTIVEHNLANETDVWSVKDEDKTDFKLELTYREFSSEMLLSLISQSVQCSQHIKYDCSKARLGLYQYTWFKPADPKEDKVVSIGDASRGSCPCSTARNCVKGHHCNCDSMEDKWLSDEGYFTMPERLGITEMSFAVPKNLPKDAMSRITLGPLECVEANTQRYVVTFKTFGSYLEAPGWKSGDLAFSFRTTRSSAILLYQPLLHEKHSAFSVFLTNDNELTFQYVLGGSTPQSKTVRSENSLSNGEWQQVWIDFDLHEVRYQINKYQEMINLPDGQQFGPFEGTMYIAGAPENYLEKSEVKEGLIGCFRGLVMNGQVLDLYSYMKFHKADIIKDCSPSCDPNPCKNEAKCQENWGSFVCQCSNPFAHSGILCERDINVDGLTFLSQSSYIKRQSLDSQPDDPVKNILSSNIYLNIRTYDSEALVLYANDNLNNFVQLHVESETKVVFTWNEHSTIKRIALSLKKLNHGIPVQIAVIRNETHTVLHVNDHRQESEGGVMLLERYSEMPWDNPELEIFTPPRPFAPISPYYQLLLGGFDNYALKPVGSEASKHFPGMLGCLNGLQIGKEHIQMGGMANHEDVLEGCKMVCDATPCGHGGICLEDFTKRTYTCDCTSTSYYGQRCEEENAATLQGESFMRRRFSNTMEKVDDIEARFGFTTGESGNDTVLLTVQIPGQSYSLVFSLNTKGKLILKETQGSIVEGATIRQNFADGQRHSVYFKRNWEETIFIVDQEEIHVEGLSAEFTFLTTHTSALQTNVGEVFVGGVSDAVTELRHYQRFKGCFANIYVKVNNLEEIRPMDEYMGFVKKAEDVVIDVVPVENRDRIKQGCEPMHLITPKAREIQPDKNDWLHGLPKRKSLPVRKTDAPTKAGLSFDSLALILAIFFGILLISVAAYVYKVNKRYHLRKLYEDDEDDLYFTHRGQPSHYYGPTSTELKYVGYKKVNPDSVTGLLNNAAPPPIINQNNHSPVKPNVLTEEEDSKLIEEHDGDDEDDDTTSQNATGTNSEKSGGSSSSSISDNEAVDDKVFYGFFHVPTASASEMTLSTQNENGVENEDDISSSSKRNSAVFSNNFPRKESITENEHEDENAS